MPGPWGDGIPDILPGGRREGQWGDGIPSVSPRQAPVYVAEILIGDTVVWSAQANMLQQAITIDTSSYTGTQSLRLRIRRLT
jgi:hypothetical protein